MALYSKVRVWQSTLYGGNAVTVTDDVNDHFTVAGDHMTSFRAGRVFELTGSTFNDDWYTVESSELNGGDTEIYVTGNIILEGVNKGTIARYDYIDFDAFAQVVPHHNVPARYIKDRNTLRHRIISPTAANTYRYADAVTLSILALDADKLSADNRRVDEFFRANCILADSQLEIWFERASSDQESQAYTVKSCYKVYLDGIPEWLYSNMAIIEDEYPEQVAMEFYCVEDGTFTHYDDLDSSTYRSKP